MITRIMAHPRRAAAAHNLAQHPNLVGLNPRIAWDPDPAGAPSALRTFRHACLQAEPDEPLLILQEDAVPCRGFAAGVRNAWRALDERSILCLYVGQLYRAVIRMRADSCRSLHTIGSDEYTPTVAVVLPGATALDFAAWAERNAPPGYRHDDELLGIYTRTHHVRVCATLPCLANHDNQHDSIAGHRAHGIRQAWCWIGDHDASSIRWSF
jgi:hypothetical protein